MFPPQMVFVNIEIAGIQRTGLEDEDSVKEIDTIEANTLPFKSLLEDEDSVKEIDTNHSLSHNFTSFPLEDEDSVKEIDTRIPPFP